MQREREKERLLMKERRRKGEGVTEQSQLEDTWRSAVGTPGLCRHSLDSQGQTESQQGGRAPPEHQVITDNHN